MAVFLSPVGGAGAQFCDNNGNPLNGGKLYTYAAGTTTPAATYTSSAGTTFHPNPIILNAGGRVPDSGEIWLADSVIYKFVLKTSADVLIATWDQITGINSNFVNYTTETEVQTATAGQTVFTLTSVTYQPGTNNLTVYVDGVNQYEGTSYLETDSTTVTFTAGLHVGAEVKFTTAVQTTGNATSADVVSYSPPFTGSVATTVEAKLAQTVSVKDFGAVGDDSTDNTLFIQSAIDAAGIGGTIYVPSGFYRVNGTLDLLPGQIICGDGWADSVGTYALEPGSTVITQMSEDDIPLLQIIGASDADQQPRGCIKNIALVKYGVGSIVGTGFKAVNARQHILDNVYVTGFHVGVEQGQNCWQWSWRNVLIMDTDLCVNANNEGEDSTYISCIFRPFRSGAIAFKMDNMSQTNLFLGCDFSNCTTGVLMAQGDTNGDGTGTPYPMHATFINCQFEQLTSAAIYLVSSNPTADVLYYPQVTAIGCRAYIYDSPDVGQKFIYAEAANTVVVDRLISDGYSWGLYFSQPSRVGEVSWYPGVGSDFSSGNIYGALNKVHQYGTRPMCRLTPTSLSYVATNFTRVPFDVQQYDPENWYQSYLTAVQPTRTITYRIRAQIYTDSAPVGRYVLTLYKNGSAYKTLDDSYRSTAGQPLMLKGELDIEVAASTDYFYVGVYASANFTLNTSESYFLTEIAGV